MEIANLLRQVTIFRDLPAEVLGDLATRVHPRTAEAGSVIVSAEEPGDSLFVIARGKVKVVLYGETGREIILSILRAGDFFGEMSLLDRQPRSANVVALEEADLLSLDREAFEQHLSAQPWAPLALPASAADGSYAVSASPTQTTWFRLTVGKASTTVRVNVAPVVTLDGSLSGTVRPTVAGETVDVQRQDGGVWTSVGTAPLAADGSFAVPVPPQPGIYRAVVAAGGGLAAGISPLLQVE